MALKKRGVIVVRSKEQTCSDWEKEISNIEEFLVEIKNAKSGKSRRKIMANKVIRCKYDYERKRSQNNTVSQWKTGRFRKVFSDEYDVDVLFYDGTVAHGGTLLINVRNSYPPNYFKKM